MNRSILAGLVLNEMVELKKRINAQKELGLSDLTSSTVFFEEELNKLSELREKLLSGEPI